MQSLAESQQGSNHTERCDGGGSDAQDDLLPFGARNILGATEQAASNQTVGSHRDHNSDREGSDANQGFAERLSEGHWNNHEQTARAAQGE